MNFKKFIFTLFTYLIGAVFLLQTYTTPVFAESSLQNHYQKLSSTSRAERVEWRYRTYKGKKQKRLWSITYEKWLTDWLPA